MNKRAFSNKEVVLGVTGSIAAYKACDLASHLVKLGARVTSALTASATELVGAASFEAITGQRATTRMFEPLQNPEIEHIAVATRADLFLVAPATANILAKAAQGIADDWLSTTLLATRAPILFAPAMNTNMYEHPATQANIAVLRERGCHFVGPEAGRMACGTTGIGRLASRRAILEAACILLTDQQDFTGKSVVLTCGATHEPMDPVRFIANRSSGKMGRALAMESLARGARVTVISGPTQVPMPHGAEVVDVETAEEMAEAAVSLAQEADVFIGAAAVADYRVEQVADTKRKRTGKAISVKLVENPDITRLVSAVRQKGQVLVGFAAETDDVVKNAQAKLKRKKLDLILANLVGDPDSGFGTDTLEASILAADGSTDELGLLAKEDVAAKLLDRIATLL